MSRASLDLRYTHEMAATATVAVTPKRGARRIVGSDLTARLACLKMLGDAERDERFSFCTRMAMLAQSGRRRFN